MYFICTKSRYCILYYICTIPKFSNCTRSILDLGTVYCTIYAVYQGPVHCSVYCISRYCIVYYICTIPRYCTRYQLRLYWPVL